jgi:dipeptidyl aminopeptidase/acylaminoacyl peptidase
MPLFATITLFLVLALAVLRFLLLPLAVRLLWRAPRLRETATPASAGIAFRAVTLPTARGRRLHGWHLPAVAGAPALVMIHGWGGNAQSLLPLARVLHEAGFTLLLVDARNHGQSDDDDFSSMVKFAEDLDHALAWMKAQPETDPARVGILGHSVGAAAALLCASRRDDLAAVVSIAAFAHPGRLMAAMMAQRGIPFWPVGWVILRYVERAIGASFDAIAPLTTIGRIRVPVLLVHGMEDRSIPVEDARAIHARRAGDTTRLLLVPGGHQAGTALRSHGHELVGFLHQALGSLRRERGASPGPV